MIQQLKKLFHRHKPIPDSEWWDNESQTTRATCRCGEDLTFKDPWE